MSEEDGRRLVEIAATIDGHERVADRARCVRDTYRKASNGDPIKGIPSLAEVFLEPVKNKLVEWSKSIATATRKRRENGAAIEVPRPLRRPIAPAEKFPIEAMGELASVAQLLADVIQAPLAMCSQSVQAGVTLAVQAHGNMMNDGRSHSISEYFISIGESGERKTAVDNAALEAHRAHEKTLYEAYKKAQLDYENDLEAYRKAKDDALRKAKTRSEKKGALDALGLPPEAPLLPILLCEEPSYEGLFKLLQHGLPSIGLFSDEGRSS